MKKKKIIIFFFALGVITFALFYIGSSALEEIRLPTEDDQFVLKLNQEIKKENLNNIVPLENIVSGSWDAVCYIHGGPTRVSKDLQYYLHVPDDSIVNVTDGSDVISDDEFALVFVNTKTLEAQVKLVTYQSIDTYPKEKPCFFGKSKIYFEVQNKQNLNNKKHYNHLTLKGDLP